MTADSKLVSYVKASPNHSGKRTHKIDTITIHCVAANATIESLGSLFANPSRKASSQYGIGTDGRIGQYVPEAYRSWCSGNKPNDQRAITIEVSNNAGAPDWPISQAAYNSLVDLCEDICRRNNIKKLVWSTNKSDRVNHRNGCNMTCHRDFQNKSCPGNYIYNREGQIAAEVNRRLQEDDEMLSYEQFKEYMTQYLKELQDNDAGEWSKGDREWGINSGLFNGSGTLETGEPNYMWGMWATREQLAALFHRFEEKFDK